VRCSDRRRCRRRPSFPEAALDPSPAHSASPASFPETCSRETARKLAASGQRKVHVFVWTDLSPPGELIVALHQVSHLNLDLSGIKPSIVRAGSCIPSRFSVALSTAARLRLGHCFGRIGVMRSRVGFLGRRNSGAAVPGSGGRSCLAGALFFLARVSRRKLARPDAIPLQRGGGSILKNNATPGDFLAFLEAELSTICPDNLFHRHGRVEPRRCRSPAAGKARLHQDPFNRYRTSSVDP